MKIKKHNRDNERLILIGMIVDKSVLSRITVKWEGGLFRTRWANLVGGWCVDYYKQYEKAPASKVENFYAAWADKTSDKDIIKLVEKFLDGLSDEYQQIKRESNSDYIIDLAGKYFNKVRLEKLAELIQSDVDVGKVSEANERVVIFDQLELGGDEGINVLQDKTIIKEAFADKNEPLIRYDKGLGKFFNDALERDAFIAFMGPDKRGKTFWLIELGYQAMLQRRKVAFFEAGDMSRNQIVRRIMVRTSNHPLHPCVVKKPVKIKRSKKRKGDVVQTKTQTYTKRLSWRMAWKACKEVIQKKLKTNTPLLKLSCHANSTLSVHKMKSILGGWERNGWVPDVIVVDYADILDMSHGKLEGRDRINETWKQLRGISQTYHCLVVTATQSDATAYKSNILNQSHFSDDKRKLAHVTGMIGLNQTDEEKENGIIRLNWIVLREGVFSRRRCVHVVGCLDIGRPAMKSYF